MILELLPLENKLALIAQMPPIKLPKMTAHSISLEDFLIVRSLYLAASAI